jgi:hypothetical protein
VSVLFEQIYHSWNIFLLCLDLILFLAGLTVYRILGRKSKQAALIAGCFVLFLSFLDGNLYSHPNLTIQVSFWLLCVGTGLLEFAGGILLALILEGSKKLFTKHRHL